MILEFFNNTTIYISVSLPSLCSNERLRRLWLSKPTFEPSFERGTSLNFARYGDIPSSRGDIPAISSELHEIESSKNAIRSHMPTSIKPSIMGSSTNSTQRSIFKGTSSIKNAGFQLVRSLSSDSSLIQKHIINLGRFILITHRRFRTFYFSCFVTTDSSSLGFNIVQPPIAFVECDDWVSL